MLYSSKEIGQIEKLVNGLSEDDIILFFDVKCGLPAKDGLCEIVENMEDEKPPDDCEDGIQWDLSFEQLKARIISQVKQQMPGFREFEFMMTEQQAAAEAQAWIDKRAAYAAAHTPVVKKAVIVDETTEYEPIYEYSDINYHDPGYSYLFLDQLAVDEDLIISFEDASDAQIWEGHVDAVNFFEGKTSIMIDHWGNGMPPGSTWPV